MKIIEHNSSILDPKSIEMGFVIGKNMEYAAVPMVGSSTQLMIIHQGKQLKICRNRKFALNFIAKHSKGKSVGKLPVD